MNRTITTPSPAQQTLPSVSSVRIKERRHSSREDKRNERVLSSLLDRLAEHHAPTYEHCRRVASLSRQLALRLHMSRDDVRAAFSAGLLHDIGHIVTPVELLDHEGPLAPRLWAELHQHAGEGHALLTGVVFDPRVLACIRDHHERPNGTGYPNGLHLCEPITALVAVADHFDTVIRAWGRLRGSVLSRALADIRRRAGRQLDFALCRAMHDLFNEPWGSEPTDGTNPCSAGTGDRRVTVAAPVCYR